MNLKKSLFQVIRKIDLFCGGKFSDRVSSEKLLAVSAAGPPAAFFPEIDISRFFGHVPFWKKCDFAQICSKYPPRYSKILSGSSLEGLRRLSGGSPRQSVRPRPWTSLGRHFMLKPLCFSVESEKRDRFAAEWRR